MDGVFTLPYSEYKVADELNRLFKKKEYALFVPVSRQQKGIDLLLYSLHSGKKLTVQVKSSRAYYHDTEKPVRKYGIWLNNFIDSLEKHSADYYIIYGEYADKGNKNINTKEYWKDFMLCYSKNEMRSHLQRIKQKKNPTQKDNFFGYVFDCNKAIYTGRGIENEEKIVNQFLKDKIEEMKNKLK
jgi:hypothetical protein